MVDLHMDIRPRTTGEILDDAWRLFLADAPLLLALYALFGVPAVIAILLLLTQARPESWLHQPVLPALAALTIPLTGLGSAACQGVFRRRADQQDVRLGAAVLTALRHALDHVAARAVMIVAIVFTLPCLVMPGLAVWIGAASVHALLATGELRWPAALAEASRQSQRQAFKASIVTLSRVPLLLMLVLNLHLVLAIGLWVLDRLAGFDLALAELVLSLRHPVYDLCLFLFAWLLQAPYAEACNYLLCVDARTRFEGLDLWYRVRRHFPVNERRVIGALVVGLFLLPDSVHAAEPTLADVQAIRADLAAIVKAVQTAEPYRGPDRWLPGLRELHQRLQRDGQSSRLRWFAESITAFTQARTDRALALQVLHDLDERLALLAESLAPVDGQPGRSSKDIKDLLPRDTAPSKMQPPPTVRKEEPMREVRRETTVDDGPRRSGSSGVVPAIPAGGFSAFGWLLLLGILVATGIVAVRMYRQHAATRKPAVATNEPTELSLEALLAQTDRAVGVNLWRQADDLAGAGRWLEAVRHLYLAVLALLHRADLIRYAQTRTNGEYLDQLRSREDLYPPFEGLTSLFELKYYGERQCQPEDFQACRQLAEAVRGQLSS